jgi:hypothetical protein
MDTMDRVALTAQLAEDAELAAEHLETQRESDEAAKARALAGELRSALADVDIYDIEVRGILFMNLPSRKRGVQALVNLDGCVDLDDLMQSAVGEPMNLSLDWRSFLGRDPRAQPEEAGPIGARITRWSSRR